MNATNLKVNYLIVGAQKAGTTALASFLAQHPEICMARRKEIHLFDAPDYQDSPSFCDARYAVEFPDYCGQRWVGEATPIYMYLPLVAERIHRYNPQMRLIILLRNPAERAVSHYGMEVSLNRERLSLSTALAIERFRLWRDRMNLSFTSSLRDHSYIDRGFYSRQLNHLLLHFSRQQLLVIRTDDLLGRHVETLERVYKFLDLERPASFPEPQQVRLPLGPGIIETHIQPSPLMLTLLKRIYRNEIVRLEQLLGWRLDDWR
jgi:hypothetical protein